MIRSCCAVGVRESKCALRAGHAQDDAAPCVINRLVIEQETTLNDGNVEFNVLKKKQLKCNARIALWEDECVLSCQPATLAFSATNSHAAGFMRVGT